jgi:hypothetical protein
MTIIIEDGSVVAGSNSYASASQLSAYAVARNVTVTGTDTVLLTRAMDYIESLKFIGDKSTAEQPLQWPRLTVYIDGYYFRSDSIPSLLIQAQIEVALAIDAGSDPLSNIAREKRREKIGPIDIEYAPSARALTYLSAAAAKLEKLIVHNVGVFRV